MYSLVLAGLRWWVSKAAQSLAGRVVLVKTSGLATAEHSSWQRLYCFQSKVQFNCCSCHSRRDVPGHCFLPEDLITFFPPPLQ